MKTSARSQLIQLGTTAVVASLLTLFVKNFISVEKKIKKRIARQYDIADGQFERSMIQLLGQPILGGNRIRRLQNGVRIFKYQPTMFHRKVMIIDDLWVSVGSANFDNRSFRLNDEANLNVFDRDFALEESAAFENDKLLAREITWQQWKRRPLIEKIADATVGLLRSQL